MSSVNFEENIKVNETYKKGEPFGYFLFGGSDFLMLFQEQSGVKITAPKSENGKYKHALMGEEYGRLTKE